MCSRFKYRTLDILLEDYKHYNEMTLVTVIDGFTLLKHRIPVVINITQIEWSKQNTSNISNFSFSSLAISSSVFSLSVACQLTKV